jgi:hypothetical protein
MYSKGGTMIPADEGKRDYNLAEEKYRLVDILVYAVNRATPWLEGETSAETLQGVLNEIVSIVVAKSAEQGLNIVPRNMTDITEDTRRWVNATYLGFHWNYTEKASS